MALRRRQLAEKTRVNVLSTSVDCMYYRGWLEVCKVLTIDERAEAEETEHDGGRLVRFLLSSRTKLRRLALLW